MKTITVEFIGIARILARQKKQELYIDIATTYKDIIQIIGEQFPVLIGQVISPHGDGLLGTNMINLNGEYMIQEEDMNQSPKDGDRIIMMSILAGGC